MQKFLNVCLWIEVVSANRTDRFAFQPFIHTLPVVGMLTRCNSHLSNQAHQANRANPSIKSTFFFLSPSLHRHQLLHPLLAFPICSGSGDLSSSVLLSKFSFQHSFHEFRRSVVDDWIDYGFDEYQESCDSHNQYEEGHHKENCTNSSAFSTRFEELNINADGCLEPLSSIIVTQWSIGSIYNPPFRILKQVFGIFLWSNHSHLHYHLTNYLLPIFQTDVMRTPGNTLSSVEGEFEDLVEGCRRNRTVDVFSCEG